MMNKILTLSKIYRYQSIIFLLLWFFNNSAFATPKYYDRLPILFIHGSGMDSSSWQSMISSFVKTGYPRRYLLAINMDPNYGANIPAAVKFIKPAVESLLAQANETAKQAGYTKTITKINIIAHSMGGLSTRWYAAKIHPEYVHTLLTLAGANHGSNVLCGYSGGGNIELCPAYATRIKDSAVQVALNGTPWLHMDETPYGIGWHENKKVRIPPDARRSIAYYTVRIEPDEWIKPEKSAELSGAGGCRVDVIDLPLVETSPGNFLFQISTGHDGLLHHFDTYRFADHLFRACSSE